MGIKLNTHWYQHFSFRYCDKSHINT